MVEVKIFEAGPEDAFGITNVLYKTWLSTYPNQKIGLTVDDIEDSYKDEFTIEKINNLKEVIKNSPKNKKRFVAKIKDQIVGTCTAVIGEDSNNLRTLYVLPEFQGLGIGKMLWKKADDFFDPKKDTFVQVADYTENAINFYKKLGFVETGKRIENESQKFKSGAVISEIEMMRRVNV
jgi:ribosomal protein S18 acetylase RimI-like enzyme